MIIDPTSIPHHLPVEPYRVDIQFYLRDTDQSRIPYLKGKIVEYIFQNTGIREEALNYFTYKTIKTDGEEAVRFEINQI